MTQEHTGPRSGKGLRFAIVVSRFNELVTARLLAGAKEALGHGGVAPDDISALWVPGAFEIPAIAKALAQTGRFSGIVCLGCIIKGDTPHFDYVSASSINGVQQVGLETGIAIGMGILTTNNLDQALSRAGAGEANKGYEAAVTALEMATLLKQIRGV